MEALSTEIALGLYGVAIVFALWYRVASDNHRLRNARAANQQADLPSPRGPVEQPPPRLRAAPRQTERLGSQGFARVFAKRRSSSAS